MCRMLLRGAATPCFSQTNPKLQTYFKDYIGLSENQIAAVRGGQAVAKTLHSRTPEEIFVFGWYLSLVLGAIPT